MTSRARRDIQVCFLELRVACGEATSQSIVRTPVYTPPEEGPCAVCGRKKTMEEKHTFQQCPVSVHTISAALLPCDRSLLF